MASTASEDVGADDLSAEEVESDASNPQETFSPPPPMPSSPVSPPPGNLSATNVEEQDPTLADADDEEEEDEDYEQDFEDSDHFDGDAENDTIALNDETLGKTQSSEPESGSAADSIHEDLLDASEGEGEDMLEDLQSPPAVASNDVHILSSQPTGPQGHASKEANADATFSNVTGMDDVDEQDDAESSWPIEGSEMIDLEGDQAATSNGILSEESGRVHIDDPKDLSSNQGLNDIAMDQTAIGHTEDLTSDQATESSKDSPSAEAVNLQDNSLFDQADEDTKDSPMGQTTDSFLHSASKDALEDEQAIEGLEDLPSDQGMEDFKSSLMDQVNLGINSEELSTDHATESPKDSPGVEAVDLLDGSLFDNQANEEPKDSPLGHITDSLLLSPSKVASEDDQAIGELEDLPSDRHMNDSRSSLMDQANLGNNTEELSSDQATEIPKASLSAEAVGLQDDSSIDQADEDPKDSPSGHVTDYLPASPSKEASEDDQAMRELQGVPSDQGMADPEGSSTNQANLGNNTEELSSDHATEIPKGSPSAEAVDLQDRFLLVQADKNPKDSPMGQLLRGLRALGLGLDDAVMREFAKSVDVNGDGVVTFQEFFRTFETSRIDPSKQTWTPPSPVKGSFFASVRSDEVESDEGVTKKEDDDEEDDDEEAPEKEEDGDGEGDGDDDWLVRKEDVKLASAMRSRIAHEDDDFDLIESWTKTPRRKANLRCAPSREVAYMSVLRVTIHQADLAASSDVCVRCSVGDEMQRTELEEATSHPVWNEDFIFGAHEEGLPPEGSLHVRLQCDPDVGPQEWDLPFWELLYFDETDVTVRDDEVSLRKWIDGPRHKLEISLVLSTEKMEDVRRLAALQAGPIDRAALWLDKAAIAEPLSFADSKSGAPLSPASTSSVSRRPALGPGSEKDQQMLETIEDLRAQISEMRESVTEEARRRQEAEERSAVSAKQMEDLEKQRQRDAERFQYQMREQQAREDEMRTEMQLLQMKQSSGVKADERVVKLEQSIRELYADLDQRNSEISNATEAAAAARMEREDWKARVEELQVQLRQTQARYRAKSMDSTEDARAEDTKSTGPATDGAEIDRLVDTIAKLNRVISELREAERRAQAQLRASEDRIREQTADLGQLASENEIQARKIAGFEMDSRRQVAELRQAVAEKARLVKNLEEAEQQLAASDEAVAKARQERKDAEDRCVSMDARAELLQAQLSEAANKNLELSSELAEVRKLRAAQQRSTYLRPDAGLVCRHAKAQTRILRESVYRIRAEVEQMKDAAADVLAQWDSYVQLRRAKRQELASKPLTNTADLSLVRAKGISQAEDPSTVNKRLGPVRAPVAPGQVSGLARRLRLERLRRRNLHKSRMGFGEKRVRRICSVFHTPAHVEDASSPSRSLAMNGDDAQTDDSLRVEPILASAEVMVQSDNSRRYFGFDEVVYVKDMAPSDADVLAADPRLGSQNGIRAQVSPIVDALFDGDRAVVASSGPASGATTNSIISAIFDVIGSLAANLKSEEKVDAAAVLPRVSISCVHIQNSRVFDLLASNEMETRSPLRHFPELSIDRAAARATGRIDLESAGLSVVEVKTRYEAALVASMGSGNHHNMLGSLPMARNTHTTGVEGSSSSETAFLLFTVWVEMGDDAYANEEEEGAFSADLVTGKMHILEVASTGRAAFADETMEGIVKVVNAMSHRQDLDAEGGSGASPGTLMRTFSSNVVLGILRDCLDEESLGIATRSEWPQRLEKSKTHYMTGDDEMGTYERDSCMFHLLVHPSLTVCNPRSSELLTALHFAQRIRTMPLSSPNLETSSFPASASASSSSPEDEEEEDEEGSEAEINDLVASLVAGQNVNLDALDALELEEHANLSKQFDALRTEVARGTPGGRSAKRRPASASASNRRLRTPGSRSVTNRAREEGSRSHALPSDVLHPLAGGEVFKSVRLDDVARPVDGVVDDETATAQFGTALDVKGGHPQRRQADLTARKAQARREKDLVARARQLRGLDAKPKSEAEVSRAEDDLRARLAKLQAPSAPAASLGDLEARLAKLGPSQFAQEHAAAAAAEQEDQDPRVKKALEDAEARGAVDIAADDPDLEMLLRKLDSDENVTDEALQALLAGVDHSGVGHGTEVSAADDDEVALLMRQARDFARVGGVPLNEDDGEGPKDSAVVAKKGKKKTKARKGADSDEDDESSDESDSSDDDDSSSDDSDASYDVTGRRVKSSKAKKGAKKKVKKKRANQAEDCMCLLVHDFTVLDPQLCSDICVL
ncbi:Hypothetical Protein FCC1311_039942 [Hondaea fermentalgiana]|uniref:EF-hand domain-containing protein n=1 Tax=Hondaea fermentalgiana TaxID=2315210 RepID=A0A2R5GHK7_9STRA|nr:Hypothetical Protein FCC1311_039942 [Hondaea fermentalgiana]|eukprot:GBG27771.1 Hypothetical Protein FCC1311_039942 [Hondaea fermentalgiana]